VTGAGGPEGGLALPSGMLSAATYMVGTDEWLMLALPAQTHPGMLRRTALAWLDSAPPLGGSVAFVPVPPIDPVLGLAVLHHRAAGTAVYCGEDHLGTAAAGTLSLITSTSTPVLLADASPHGPPRTRVTTVSHGRWVQPSPDRSPHPSLHPVIAHVAPPQTTIYACDCQITPALADTLTILCTEQLRRLHARRTAWPRPVRRATLPPGASLALPVADSAARSYSHGD
jgi:hypothetical protein